MIVVRKVDGSLNVRKASLNDQSSCFAGSTAVKETRKNSSNTTYEKDD